jgi:hypothetical protein
MYLYNQIHRRGQMSFEEWWREYCKQCSGMCETPSYHIVAEAAYQAAIKDLEPCVAFLHRRKDRVVEKTIKRNGVNEESRWRNHKRDKIVWNRA